jgi:phosphoheptose isomerase
MKLDVETLIPQINEQSTLRQDSDTPDLVTDSTSKTKLDTSSSEQRSLAEIRSHLLSSAEVKQKTIDQCSQALLNAARVVSESFRQGGKLLLCGNGGSAADCQHTAAEFVNRLSKDFERPGLPAISLTTDTSFMTAIANDYGFDALFARQVETLGKAGDVLLGISTSGRSPNVVQALQAAKNKGMHTILLTGNSPNLEQVADIVIGVPSDHTQYIQETHLAIEHLLCSLVETELFG